MRKHRKPSDSELFEIERERAAEMTDRELSRELERNWDEGNFAEMPWSDEEKELLFAKIATRISDDDDRDVNETRSESKHHIIAKIMKYAAAILLPILVISTFYFHHEASREIDCTSIITTGPGETATVTLPDGSEIKINNESSLAYNPHSFSRGKRMVDLNGEAYFNVTRDQSHPFRVNGEGMSVNVLGTKFNVRSRESENVSSVFLTEGSVAMHCDGVKEEIVLQPWQKAVFDKKSDTVEIIDTDSKDADLVWLNNEMAFVDAPLTNVINEIEAKYGVTFDKSTMTGLLDDRFTGTLPGDDISTVLDILEDVYDVEFTLDRRLISVK